MLYPLHIQCTIQIDYIMLYIYILYSIICIYVCVWMMGCSIMQQCLLSVKACSLFCMHINRLQWDAGKAYVLQCSCVCWLTCFFTTGAAWAQKQREARQSQLRNQELTSTGKCSWDSWDMNPLVVQISSQQESRIFLLSVYLAKFCWYLSCTL